LGWFGKFWHGRQVGCVREWSGTAWAAGKVGFGGDGWGMFWFGRWVVVRPGKFWFVMAGTASWGLVRQGQARQVRWGM